MPTGKKKIHKRVFEWRGGDGDELVEAKTHAPKKGERKKLARVGQQLHEQAPRQTNKADGMSNSERTIAIMLQNGGQPKRRKRAAENGRQTTAMKRLKAVEKSAGRMGDRQYKQALNQALYSGLSEDKKKSVPEKVAREAGAQTEKNRKRRHAKKERHESKQAAVSHARNEEVKFRGGPEHVPFGQQVQAPPAGVQLSSFTAKLDLMKEKIARKQNALAAAAARAEAADEYSD